MKTKNAFTLLEIVFVILILGILGKFGVEFLVQAYKSYISTQINNKFQNQSATAIEFIAKRLQYRIKSSVIVRDAANFANYRSLEGFTSTGYNVMEWVGYDIDGLRAGNWSGIYSKASSGVNLVSPDTNTTALTKQIFALSGGTKGVIDSAIFLIGSDSNLQGFGWDGNPVLDYNQPMKPVVGDAANIFTFDPSPQIVNAPVDFNTLIPSLQNLEYNSYQLAWTAYAVIFDPTNHQLQLCYNYQPWNGQTYNNNATCNVIMDQVSDFRKKERKGVITIKVCSINETLKDIEDGEFLTCKEKTIL